MIISAPRNVYNPADWYWAVGGSTTQVWSSARVQYVPVTDATFTAWLTRPHVQVTQIPTEEELAAVFAEQYPAGWPATLAQQAGAMMGTGLVVTSTGTPALSGTYSADATSIAHVQAEMTSILAAVYLGLPATFADGTTSVTWSDVDGNLHVFPTVASWIPFGQAIGAFYAALVKVQLGTLTKLPLNTATIP